MAASNCSSTFRRFWLGRRAPTGSTPYGHNLAQRTLGRGRGAAQVGCGQRGRDGEAGGLPVCEPDVDAAGLAGEGDVVEQQADRLLDAGRSAADKITMAGVGPPALTLAGEEYFW